MIKYDEIFTVIGTIEPNPDLARIWKSGIIESPPETYEAWLEQNGETGLWVRIPRTEIGECGAVGAAGIIPATEGADTIDMGPPRVGSNSLHIGDTVEVAAEVGKTSKLCIARKIRPAPTPS